MKFILDGITKQTFQVGKPIAFWFVNCKRFATANTTTRTITGVGKVLFKTNGEIQFTPIKDYKGEFIAYGSGCDFERIDITFEQNSVVVEPPTGLNPTKYIAHRKIGNTSANQSGDGLIRALRSPTGLAWFNNRLYVTTGLAEGNSSLMSIKDQVRTEHLRRKDGGIGGNMTHVVTDGNLLYVAMFDSYKDHDNNGYKSRLTSAIIAMKADGTEHIFTSGKPFYCTYQESYDPYKSGIHINVGKVTRLDVDETTLYVFCGSTCYEYDKTTGVFKKQSTFAKWAIIGYHSKGSVSIAMFEDSVSLNGNRLLDLQTTPEVTDYKFYPKDFNMGDVKGAVCIGDNSVFVADAGNCRVMEYDLNGVFKGLISYLPMNYNCAVDQNNHKKVFAKELEFEVEYPSLNWKLVKNWAVGLPESYNPKGDNLVRDFLRDVITLPTGTFGFVDYHEDGSRKPTLMKMTPTGLEVIRQFDWFANVSQLPNGDIISYQKENGKANFYINDILKESVVITSESALNSDAKIGYTSDGYFVVYEPSKEHKGFHLSWVKDGKIINGMPTKIMTEREARKVPFEYGDFFPIDDQVEYAGSNRVYVVDNKVFVNYVGEKFGGWGGQTSLWFMYELGKMILRVGKTKWEMQGEAVLGEAGNSYGGGVVKIGDKYYIHTNCEHTGALTTFELS